MTPEQINEMLERGFITPSSLTRALGSEMRTAKLRCKVFAKRDLREQLKKAQADAKVLDNVLQLARMLATNDRLWDEHEQT